MNDYKDKMLDQDEAYARANLEAENRLDYYLRNRLPLLFCYKCNVNYREQDGACKACKED